jgi:hypothetical protein
MKYLVVFVLPSFAIIVLRLPLFVLRQRIETQLLLALPGLDDGRDEFDQEVGYAEQRGVKVVEEVDDQTLDVRSIVILICHDHQMAVSQAVGRGVIRVVFQTQDLLDVLDLDIFHNRVVRCVSHIEQLSSQRKDSIIISSNDTESGYRESFGRVSFGQDQGTSLGVPATRVVGVFKLDDTGYSGV